MNAATSIMMEGKQQTFPIKMNCELIFCSHEAKTYSFTDNERNVNAM